MNESITFNGYDTRSDLGLVLVEKPDLDPPEVKTNLVEIPGGDGSVDLSEFSGDVRYGDRELKFSFLMQSRNPSDIEREKTDLLRKLHGKRSDFTLSFDPGYTYNGRAAVTEFSNGYHGSVMEMEIIADPYKYGGRQIWHVNAAGGIRVVIPCGRKRWCPTFQTERTLLVSFLGQSWEVPPGTHQVTELYLEPGDSILTLNTDPGYGVTVWSDFPTETWVDLADVYPRWYQVAAGSSPRQTPYEWDDYPTETWEDFGDARWIELTYDADADPTYAVYILTEIYEL